MKRMPGTNENFVPGIFMIPGSQYKHKSGAYASRYANIGVGLWECNARNNP